MFFHKNEKYESMRKQDNKFIKFVKSQTMDELMEVDPNSLQNRVVKWSRVIGQWMNPRASWPNFWNKLDG